MGANGHRRDLDATLLLIGRPSVARAEDGAGANSHRSLASPVVLALVTRQLCIRHLAFVVEDIDAVVVGLRARGAELVGELERYEDSYRLCYVRGPEGIIELAERIGERVESVAESQS